MRCGCGFDQNAGDDDFCNACGAALRAPEARSSDGHHEVLVDRGFAGTSDIGRRHQHNEDAIGACAIEVDGRRVRVLVLCDGVSTSFQPEVAAQLGVATAVGETTLQLVAGVGRAAALKAGLVAARDAVAGLPGELGTTGGISATTIVAAVIGEDRRVDFGWLGDSRLYWLSDAGSLQLTRDDSWSNDATASDRRGLSDRQIRERAHVITRCLGARQSGLPPHDPHTSSFEMTTAGVLVAATDGFHGDTPTPDDMRVVAAGMGLGAVDALTLTRNLVTYSNNRGGRDNISVIAVLVDPLDPPAS